jgi:phage tail-like protein
VTLTSTSSAVPSGRQRPRRDPDWMLQQLPVSMLGEDFFVRFLRIFQDLGSSLLEDADNIDHVVDVTVAPPAMVRWLGSWIGVSTIDDSLPEQLQRRIVGGAAQTLTWRGTAHGLTSYLELVSGAPVVVEEGGGVWRAGDAPEDTAWVRMHTQATGVLDQADFVAVVRDEIPAHVRAELYVGSQLVWSSQEEGRT